VLGQAIETLVPSRPVARRQRGDTLVNEPDSADIREERTRARRAAEGFGKGNTLALPDEIELTADTFLRTHCIVPTIRDSSGTSGIRFLETSRGNGFGIQGTIWIDAATRLMQRVELDYLNGDAPIGAIAVDYSDVAIGGTTLRLPTSGWGWIRPLDAPRGTTATTRLSFGYSRFEDRRSPPDEAADVRTPNMRRTRQQPTKLELMPEFAPNVNIERFKPTPTASPPISNRAMNSTRSAPFWTNTHQDQLPDER
jgi:hypothetical protein